MPVNSFEGYTLSWKPKLPSGGVRYLELARQLEDDILAGVLEPGTKLPPQRELADYLDLNFTTVTRAYDVCRAKGLIYGVVGRGTFVASDVRTQGARAAIELGVVEAFAAFGADEVLDAARRVLARGDATRLFNYAARDGRSGPREAALKWLARSGIRVSREQVAVFPGTQSALSVALLSLFQPGDRLAVDAFTYANFIELAYLAHVKLVPVKGDVQGMLPGALREAVVRDRVKGVFLMPTKANPTGVTMPRARRVALARLARAHQLLILEDDSAFFPEERELPPFFSLVPERTVHVSGSTRYLAPGLRVAFVAFAESVSARLLSGLHHLVIKASSLDAEILGELLLSDGADRLVARKHDLCTRANRIFDRVCGGSGFGFFRTLPLPGTEGRGRAIEAAMLATGVRVFHSDRFAVDKGRNAFLRVSVSSVTEPQILTDGLQRCLAGVRPWTVRNL